MLEIIIYIIVFILAWEFSYIKSILLPPRESIELLQKAFIPLLMFVIFTKVIFLFLWQLGENV